MTVRRPIALEDLLREARVKPLDIQGNPRAMVTGISSHAQRTGRNELFVAISGTRIDSHMMLGEAVDSGASVLVVERETQPYPGVTVVRVENTHLAIGRLAHAFHRNPARAMNVCGVTGTNGKTSTAHLMSSIFRFAGCRAGQIGTLGAYFEGKTIRLNTTTPGALELSEIFSAMDDDRIEFVVMEVSSHAAHQHRISGIPFRCGAFLNISQDHLDYHGTMEAYAAAKFSFFENYVSPTPGSVACFNLDSIFGRQWAHVYRQDSIGFSVDPETDCPVRALEPQCRLDGTSFKLIIEGETHEVESCLVGAFNVENMLAAASACYSMGIDARTIARALNQAPSVPGRFEFIREGQEFSVVVDYAHTPEALELLLASARCLCKGRIITVFGCGGDRDRVKRAMMGRTVGGFSDFVIVTNDNPRTEDPHAIARQAVEGILQSPLKTNRYQVVLDRRDAIEQALYIAGPDDFVIIAGKGHEDYQDVGTTRLPFDDRLVARGILQRMNGNKTQQEWLETVRESSQ